MVVDAPGVPKAEEYWAMLRVAIVRPSNRSNGLATLVLPERVNRAEPVAVNDPFTEEAESETPEAETPDPATFEVVNVWAEAAPATEIVANARNCLFI